MGLAESLPGIFDADARLSANKLVDLSNLSSPDLAQVKKAWASAYPERRRQVLEALAGLSEDNVELDFTALLRHALSDDDGEVRALAIAGLWECEERSLIPVLLQQLQSDPSENVRAAAAQALGRFALLAEIGKLLPRDANRVGDALLDAFDNADEATEVRRRALEAVSSMTLPRVLEIIREAYEDEEPMLKASAIYAMGHTCDRQWLPTLLIELENIDSELRYEAAGALGELGEEEAIVHLVPLIHDSDSQVRAATLHALGAIGGPLAKKVLQRALLTDDPAIAEQAQQALRAIEFEDNPLAME
ncbi:MAG: HEAT repeat domain-containing protein [Chloroflexi bacterium]|nr:HEAT repeat domain-containing protein [Chloroflexota bacterium]